MLNSAVHDLFEWAQSRYPEAEIYAELPDRPSLLHAGDPGAEYDALTRGAVLLINPDWAPILVEGSDAVSYLHRRLSQDVQNLALGAGAHALQLGGDGRMQAELLIYRGNEALFCFVPVEFAEATVDLIEKYTLNEDVTVDRHWEDEVTISLAGPLAPAILAGLLDPKIEERRLREERWITFFTVNLGGLPVRIFRDGRWPIPWFHLCIPPMALMQMVNQLDDICRASMRRDGTGFITGVAGRLASRVYRIESGVTRFGVETTADTIPLEAHLQGALSLNKGCWPGQEVIARITNLGHPAKALVRLEIEGERPNLTGAGILIHREPVGRVASLATWPGLGHTVGMGYVQWKHRQAHEVELVLNQEFIPARLIPILEESAGAGEQEG